MRLVQIPLHSRVINTFYDLPPTIDCEHIRLVETMNVNKWNKGLKALTIEGSK